MLETIQSYYKRHPGYNSFNDRHLPDESIRYARFRKLLLLAPLVVFPLLTLLIWSCGLLVPSLADARGARSSLVGRINSSLPAAILPADSDWTKLTYYLKADQDSRKRTEAQKRDPYYGLQFVDTGFAKAQAAEGTDAAAGASTTSPISALVSGVMPDLPGKRRPGSSVRAVYSHHPARRASSISQVLPSLRDDSQVREVYRKLNSLRQALDQASATESATESASASAPTSAPTSAPSLLSASSYSHSITSAAASAAAVSGGAAGLVAAAVPDPARAGVPGDLKGLGPEDIAAPDPEMAQIAEVMDKILAVQHPELITDSLRRAAEKRMVEVYAATGVPPDPIGSLALTGGSGAPGPLSASRPTRAEEDAHPVHRRHVGNRFYTIGKGFTSGDVRTGRITLNAMVPETQVLKNGTRVKLELSGDMYVKGIRIPKGTLLYGRSRFGTGRMMVNITSLVTSGEIIPVALSVYDLDGLEGIHIPEAGARQSLKSSGARAVESMGIGTLNPSIGAQAADAGIQAARSLLGKKIRKVQVTLRAGYRLLLKDQTGP